MSDDFADLLAQIRRLRKDTGVDLGMEPVELEHVYVVLREPLEGVFDLLSQDSDIRETYKDSSFVAGGVLQYYAVLFAVESSAPVNLRCTVAHQKLLHDGFIHGRVEFQSAALIKAGTPLGLSLKGEDPVITVAKKTTGELPTDAPMLDATSIRVTLYGWELPLDHRDPRKKVSSSIWNWGAAKRIAELRKTQVLCKRCHKLKTRREREPAHGTRTRYLSPLYRCRCKKCVAANARYKRNLRSKQP